MDKRAVLAATAAALFTMGVSGLAAADSHTEGEKVKCEGVNSCKGQSECKTDHSECGGHNSCKGKGWMSMSPEECEKAKASS